MKKHSILLLSSTLSIILVLSGCGSTYSANTIGSSEDQPTDIAAFSNDASSSEEETNYPVPYNETEAAEQSALCSLPLQSANTLAEQGGPYGKISLSIPDGWLFNTCPPDSDELLSGL